MVKLTLALVSVLSFATVSLSASVQRSVETVDQIKADIADLRTKLITLGTTVNNYPTTVGTLSGALAIHSAAQVVVISLAKAAIDVVAAGSLSVSDGTVILNSVQALEPTIANTLTAIINRKASITGLGVGGIPVLVLQDLKFLQGNATILSNALITNDPASLTTAATSLRDKIIALFGPAIDAFST